MVFVHFPVRNLVLAATFGVLASSVALAAGTREVAQAQARYQQEMADCNSGQARGDLVACRREATNALAEARRGQLHGAPGQYERNALQRCAVHQGNDRADCEARIRDPGNVTGSVEDGGVLRSSVRVLPGN
jgi:hypothetical protein